MLRERVEITFRAELRFNGHPPLGVNATFAKNNSQEVNMVEFQRAPTLGGECYHVQLALVDPVMRGFNGHPPLGVNATEAEVSVSPSGVRFQRAPTLGGECYGNHLGKLHDLGIVVSTGTHPWG